MDDFNLNTVLESRAEWCEEFIMIVKPHIMEGFDDIFRVAHKQCVDTQMEMKYLVTFQMAIARIPKWSNATVEQESRRICERSHCNYLEVLLTTTHIAQLKILSAIRAGSKPKKIDIDIPSLPNFVHNIYINCARKLYQNAYLYQMATKAQPFPALEVQRNRRQIDLLLKEGILETFRKTIPFDKIMKAYLEPTEEEGTTVELAEQYLYANGTTEPSPLPLTAAGVVAGVAAESVAGSEYTSLSGIDDNVAATSAATETPTLDVLVTPMDSGPHLTFQDIDMAIDRRKRITEIEAPKNIERLEEISTERMAQRKREAAAEAAEDAALYGGGGEDQTRQESLIISDEPTDFVLPELFDDSTDMFA